MDPKIAKKTQDTLGKIIKKPPLTEKLLGKPPFRFLHDIMTSVIKTTGFMQGLFSESEMNSENVKDKDAKIAFLQKAIDMVCTVTGKDLIAKPVKIVAGHEPDRTNEFLQALADAINKNVDNDEYVKRVVKGGRESGSNEEKREVKKEKDKLKSEDRKKGQDSEAQEKRGQEKDERKQRMDRGDQEGERKHERDREKDRHKEKEKRQDRDREKDRQGEKKHDRDGEKHKDRERDSKHRDKSREARGHDREVEKDRERHKDRERESKTRDKSREDRHRDKDAEKSKKRDQSLDKENESPDREKMNGDMEEKHEPPTRLQRPASAKGTRRRREDDEELSNQREPMLGEGDLPPQVVAARQLARPFSARPAPPRPKQDTLESEPAMRLGTGHPTNVIADDDDADDDDDNFLVQETVPPPPDADLTPLKPLEDHDTKHGALVQKMLESKKEVERGNQGPAKKTEIERPLISDAQRRKQRESVQKEVDKLRGSIQSLTRSANPLGKVMDYVQEDMDSMQQELDKWRSENVQHAQNLKREMNVTDRAIDPLRQQLAELDRAISDQLDRIAATKSNIIRNDQKTQKMLRGISSS